MTAGKTAFWLALGLAGAMLAATASAQGPRGEGGWGGGWERGDHPRMERFQEHHLERMAEFLDLTPQQVEQWRQAMDSRAADREAEMETLHGLHERIRELAGSEAPDATEVGELVIETHRRMTAVDAEREAFHAELALILTPEQRDRFEALQELRPERAGGRHGHGPGRGPRHHPGGGLRPGATVD